MARDTLFRQPDVPPASFRFDEQVAGVFADMINRSVPGYADTLAGIRDFAARLVPEGGRCYDLGCSLGAAVLAICAGLGDRRATILGIDNAASMIERCNADPRFQDRPQAIRFIEQDIADADIRDADLVVMNFTLQFVAPEARTALVQRIHDGLRPGGALILSEKFRFDDATLDELLIALHHDFKRRNDYSDLEIAAKRTALENVLVPDTPDMQLARLRHAGFAHAGFWMQNLNFGSLIALRAAPDR
jgi:tRNA (cmo5U34)-methyltransferase